MSYVDLCHMSILMFHVTKFPMSNLRHPNVTCQFKELSQVMFLTLILMSPRRMSILRNPHVTMSNLVVNGPIWRSLLEQTKTIMYIFLVRAFSTMHQREPFLNSIYQKVFTHYKTLTRYMMKEPVPLYVPRRMGLFTFTSLKESDLVLTQTSNGVSLGFFTIRVTVFLPPRIPG